MILRVASTPRLGLRPQPLPAAELVIRARALLATIVADCVSEKSVPNATV